MKQLQKNKTPRSSTKKARPSTKKTTQTGKVGRPKTKRITPKPKTVEPEMVRPEMKETSKTAPKMRRTSPKTEVPAIHEKKPAKPKLGIPNTKMFTVAELRELNVPDFQRWVVVKNKTELRSSMEQIGALRSPVICHVKNRNKTYIIDGNHLREIIIEDPQYKDTDSIVCIYTEVETFADAALQYQLLNTKGKKLDWVDITILYKHVYGEHSVYNQIWSLFLGSPSNRDDVKKYPGFSTPTIIEFLVGDKTKYRNGGFGNKLPVKFIKRKDLLSYLLMNQQTVWNDLFPKGKKRPTGAAILGFSNFWFNNGVNEKFGESAFLTMVNNIYMKYQKLLKDGTMIINRDNAGKLFKEYLVEQKYKGLDLK